MKNNKGITLIALIITIVVMLILVAVSINVVIKSNILSAAKNAAERTGDEIRKETKLEDSIKIGDKTLKEYLKEEISDGWDGITTELPELKEKMIESEKVFDWYIYTNKQLKFLANFVNDTMTEDDEKLLEEKEVTKEDITITSNTTIYLMNDLNLGAEFDNDGNLISGTEWIPIAHTSDKLLRGTFEGNNHYICGVYINNNEKYNGIFGCATTIKNLTIKNSYIKGAQYTGGIVGIMAYGTIENCHGINIMVMNDQKDSTTIGGLIGRSELENVKDLTIRDSYIKGATETGGIVGVTTTGTIENCHNINTTVIIGYEDAQAIGGIVGKNLSMFIKNCTNTGNVTCNHELDYEVSKDSHIGGIVGISAEAEITNCKNYGNVRGCARTGGIIRRSWEKKS